jgi:hypothetical protein
VSALVAALTPGRRLALAIGIIALVHLGLLRFGNEDATPLRLLGSFGLATAMLVASFQIKKHLLQATTPTASTPTPRDPR